MATFQLIKLNLCYIYEYLIYQNGCKKAFSYQIADIFHCLITLMSHMDFLCVCFWEVCLMAPWADCIRTDVQDKLLNENLIITHSIWVPQLKDNQVSADDMLQMSLLQVPIEWFPGIFSLACPISKMSKSWSRVYTGCCQYSVRSAFLHLETVTAWIRLGFSF